MRDAAGGRGRALRLALRFGALVALVVAANLASDAVVDALELEVRPSTEPAVHRMIMVTAVVYAALLAIPFVPGVEIGLALIGMLGPKIVFLVYVCTVAGLSIAFLVGRMVPTASLVRTFEDLRLHRTAALLAEMARMDQPGRLAFLATRAPGRLAPMLLRYRYFALALAINLPGNVVLGGGGGLAMMAGVSRLYSVPGFALTTAIAVAPVPLAVLAFGKGILGG